MQPFEYKGRRIEFRPVAGHVTGSHKHAETHVYGGGGGGSQGNSAPVTISSSTVTKQEFFLKRVDNQPEIAIQLSGLDIPIRDGQAVTMVLGELEGKGEGYWIRLVNHDMGRYWRTCSAQPLLDRQWKLFVPDRPHVILGFAIIIGTPILLADVTNATFVNIVAGLAAGSAYLWGLIRKAKATIARFDTHCDALAQSVLADVKPPSNA